MQGTTLSFSNIHHHGDLFANILRARAPARVANAFDLPQPQNNDYDQYDTPQSRWIAVSDDNDNVLASLRLTPTTAQSGIYSYMIKDAQNGLLEDVPIDLLDEEAPISTCTWEVTRGFVSTALPLDQRHDVRARLVNQLRETSKEEKIDRLIALLPASWRQWAGNSCLEMRKAGRVLNLKGSKYQTVWLDCDHLGI